MARGTLLRSLPFQRRHSRHAGEWNVLSLDGPPEDLVEQILLGYVLEREIEALRLARPPPLRRIAFIERYGGDERAIGSDVRRLGPYIAKGPAVIVELREGAEP